MTGGAPFWWTTIGVGLTGVVTRSSLLLFGSRFVLPAKIDGALRHAPAVALAAIITPTLFGEPGVDGLSVWNPRLAAAVVAILVAWRTRGMLSSMLAGAGVYLALHLLTGA